MKKAVCGLEDSCTLVPPNIPPEVKESLEKVGGLEGLETRSMSPEAVLKNCAMFKALSDPFRIKIISLLSVQPLCVCIIREFLQISDTRLSYHLKKLSSMGLIEGTSQGNWIIYELTDIGKKALSLCDDQKPVKSKK